MDKVGIEPWICSRYLTGFSFVLKVLLTKYCLLRWFITYYINQLESYNCKVTVVNTEKTKSLKDLTFEGFFHGTGNYEVKMHW